MPKISAKEFLGTLGEEHQARLRAEAEIVRLREELSQLKKSKK